MALDTLSIDSSMMTRHCLCIGATGAGKSNFLNLILKQQMMRGGGVLNIDGKFSNEALIQFLSLAKQHNRWHDARVINISSEKHSNSYNPLFIKSKLKLCIIKTLYLISNIILYILIDIINFLLKKY